MKIYNMSSVRIRETPAHQSTYSTSQLRQSRRIQKAERYAEDDYAQCTQPNGVHETEREEERYIMCFGRCWDREAFAYESLLCP